MTKLRGLRLDDIGAVDPLLMAAYANPLSYRPRLERLLDLGPEDWLLAEVEGRPVGMGGITVMGTVAYVGLVAVKPEEQGRGIATLVMRSLIGMAGDRGCATILLDASPAGRPLYEKLGFVAEDEATVWKREAFAANPTGAGRPGILVTTLDEESRKGERPAEVLPEELAAFDAGAIGWDRSRVLASFIANDPGLVALAREGSGLLCGYAVVQPGYGVLGPWVARDSLAADALLDWALIVATATPTTAYVPGANKAAAQALSSRGFAPLRNNAHMRLGEALPFSRRLLVYSQASFALG